MATMDAVRLVKMDRAIRRAQSHKRGTKLQQGHVCSACRNWWPCTTVVLATDLLDVLQTVEDAYDKLVVGNANEAGALLATVLDDRTWTGAG